MNDDSISRQAAIDTLCDNCDHVEAVCPHYPCKQHIAIENLPSAQSELNTQLYTDGFTDGYIQCKKDKVQWTPCSKRLPKKERQQYWVCTDTGYQCQCRWTDNIYGFGPSNNWGWKIFDIPQYQKVVAWMSLPEPYNEMPK